MTLRVRYSPHPKQTTPLFKARKLIKLWVGGRGGGRVGAAQGNFSG